MTRRANAYRRTTIGTLLAAAGSCLAATVLAPAVFAPAADAAGGGSVAPTSDGAATPSVSGGAATSGTTTVTATTPVATAPVRTTTTRTTTTPTVVVDPSSGAVSGGTGLAGSSGSQSADAIVSASGGGFTLQVHASGLTDQRLSFSGTAPASDADQEIVLQRAPAGDTGAATWVNAAEGPIAPDGTFTVGWKASQSGHFQVRAVLASVAAPTTPEPATSTTAAAVTTTGTAASATSPDSPAVDVTIFKAADATFYGPGLWGRHTACGEVLRRTTLGVANRTIKCGTEIDVYFNGREITVPVIDRGPYVKGVDWDLTKAAADAVGLTDQIGRGTVGTLIVDSLTTGTL